MEASMTRPTPESPAYWTGVHCTDCGIALTAKNGIRRPVAEGVYQLVCMDCLLAPEKERT